MVITLEDKVVKRGKQQMQVNQFCELIAQNCVTGLRDEPIPDNVRWIVESGHRAVYIVELQPELRQLIWNNHGAHRNYETHEYREIGTRHTVATPYVVLMIPFLRNKINGSMDRPVRVFYRNEPLTSIDDPVLSSNLNNVLPTGYGTRESGCLCLDRLDVNSEMSRAEVVSAVVNHLWGGEFNMEYASNFAYVADLVKDQRISNIHEWEAESKKNPGFVLDVKWPETKITIRTLINQELANNHHDLGKLILKAK